MSRHPTSEHTTERSPKHTREEGAVLMIVVLLLLVVTATGTYAVHATTSELAGAGSTRTAYQTETMATSLAEGALDWVDRLGPATLYRQASFNERNSGGAGGLDLTGAEPVQLAAGQLGTRLYVSDLSATTSSASAVELVGASSLNNGVPETATGVVDVYDIHLFSGDVAGARSDGYGTLRFLRATYTARAHARLPLADSVHAAIRERHTTTATARAVGTSGPFSM